MVGAMRCRRAIRLKLYCRQLAGSRICSVLHYLARIKTSMTFSKCQPDFHITFYIAHIVVSIHPSMALCYLKIMITTSEGIIVRNHRCHGWQASKRATAVTISLRMPESDGFIKISELVKHTVGMWWWSSQICMTSSRSSLLISFYWNKLLVSHVIRIY